MPRSGFLLALALLLVLGLGFGAWLAFLPNASGSERGRGVRLPPGTTFSAAIDSLETSGGLASATSLRLFGRITGWGEQVKTGHYLIGPGMSNWAMLDKIRKGLQDPIRVTIPAGSRPQTVAGTLARQLGADSTEILQAFSDAELARELGTDTAHLFGRMRANTYDILWTTDARRAVARVHGWYERFWTDEREAKAERLGLTPDEVVTMASIVEWEARQPEERPRIAGVYLNRLLGRTSSGRMRLQADPTVQYAMMLADGQPMRRLFLRDYQFPSPYNTYLNDGLPPGPITNPSESSIDGVLDNERHEYLFFVANGTGGHTFNATLAGHNRAAAEWSRYISEQVRLRAERDRAAAATMAAPN